MWHWSTNSHMWVIFVNHLSTLWRLVHQSIMLVMVIQPMWLVDNQSSETITIVNHLQRLVHGFVQVVIPPGAPFSSIGVPPDQLVIVRAPNPPIGARNWFIGDVPTLVGGLYSVSALNAQISLLLVNDTPSQPADLISITADDATQRVASGHHLWGCGCGD